jgi:hypothetical protein
MGARRDPWCQRCWVYPTLGKWTENGFSSMWNLTDGRPDTQNSKEAVSHYHNQLNRYWDEFRNDPA